MKQPIQIRTQSNLLTELKARLRDTSDARWTAAEKYLAINSALQTWDAKVKMPFLYTVPGGWSSNLREYELPNYIHHPIDPQLQLTGVDYWQDILAYEVMPDDGNGSLLKLGFYPPSTTGRVIHWAVNSVAPTTIPVLYTGGITSTATSAELGATVDILDNGYVKIDQEWLQYSGYTVANSRTTLTNLVRGCFNTTAASHLAAANVEWGVAVHRSDLYEQLFMHCRVFVNELFLTDASNTEKETHQWLVRWYQPLAAKFWQSYTPARTPKTRLSRLGIGDVSAPGVGREYWRQGDIWGHWG